LKILIVDDHELFRMGLSLALTHLHKNKNDEKTLEVVQAGNAAEAIEVLEQTNTFDLLLLDLGLPDLPGLELMEQCRGMVSDTPIVIMSGIEKTSEIKKALQAGASGFIPKSLPTAVILSALELVLSGGRYLPPQLLFDEQRTEQLTQRQVEVLQSMNHGLSNKLIARELDLSESTVKSHIRNIFSILQAKNRSHAISIATQMKLL